MKKEYITPEVKIYECVVENGFGMSIMSSSRPKGAMTEGVHNGGGYLFF